MKHEGKMNSAFARALIAHSDFATADLALVQIGGSRHQKPASLANKIEAIDHAITASELAKLLRVSKISIYKGCKVRRIPCFRILTNVRFDPKSVAEWLRKQ